jgi:hypothetical protein
MAVTPLKTNIFNSKNGPWGFVERKWDPPPFLSEITAILSYNCKPKIAPRSQLGSKLNPLYRQPIQEPIFLCLILIRNLKAVAMGVVAAIEFLAK